jgi:hypothetical protein
MTAIARKNLMSWDEVEWFYQTVFPSIPQDKLGPLQHVAATSIFQAWWSGRLDGQDCEQPEEMCYLSVLRQEIPQLDKDLHELCELNEAEVRRKWEEKDKAKKSTFNAESGEGGGWDPPVDTAGSGTAEWDNSNATASNTQGGNNWDSGDVFADEQPFAPPNSLASPDFAGLKNAPAPLSPLHEITNGNGNGNDFGTNGNNGHDMNGGHRADWADEVNDEVTDQGNQYDTSRYQW